MRNKLTFLKLAELVLDKVRKPLSVNEIWEKAKELDIVNEGFTSGKTPWTTIGAQIYVDIRDNPNSLFYQYRKNPTKFYLKKYSSDESLNDKNPPPLKPGYKFIERDLHPLLVKFTNANTHFKSYLKTIFHESSLKGKKGLNKWLHPDMVGVYFPFKDFEETTLKFQEQLSISSIKLFSFELKINLDLSNLRKSFFQTVSNSSWANEGYLIALNIADDPEFIDELRRLNNAFGIGIIKINSINIHESEILFPSKINHELDWDTVDRLTSENKDFKKFLKDIIEDLKIGKVKSRYDKLLSDEELENYLKEKKIK